MGKTASEASSKAVEDELKDARADGIMSFVVREENRQIALIGALAGSVAGSALGVAVGYATGIHVLSKLGGTLLGLIAGAMILTLQFPGLAKQTSKGARKEVQMDDLIYQMVSNGSMARWNPDTSSDSKSAASASISGTHKSVNFAGLNGTIVHEVDDGGESGEDCDASCALAAARSPKHNLTTTPCNTNFDDADFGLASEAISSMNLWSRSKERKITTRSSITSDTSDSDFGLATWQLQSVSSSQSTCQLQFAEEVDDDGEGNEGNEDSSTWTVVRSPNHSMTMTPCTMEFDDADFGLASEALSGMNEWSRSKERRLTMTTTSSIRSTTSDSDFGLATAQLESLNRVVF